MSFLPYLAAAVIQRGAALALSGEVISHTASDPTQARAHVIFNSDGTVDKREGGTITQLDTGTDWIIPNDAADTLYEVRYTGLTGTAFGVSAANADVWIDLSSNRTWGYTNTTNGTTDTGDATFEIRIGGGGPLVVSATYDLTAVRNA